MRTRSFALIFAVAGALEAADIRAAVTLEPIAVTPSAATGSAPFGATLAEGAWQSLCFYETSPRFDEPTTFYAACNSTDTMQSLQVVYQGEDSSVDTSFESMIDPGSCQTRNLRDRLADGIPRRGTVRFVSDAAMVTACYRADPRGLVTADNAALVSTPDGSAALERGPRLVGHLIRLPEGVSSIAVEPTIRLQADAPQGEEPTDPPTAVLLLVDEQGVLQTGLLLRMSHANERISWSDLTETLPELPETFFGVARLLGNDDALAAELGITPPAEPVELTALVEATVAFASAESVGSGLVLSGFGPTGSFAGIEDAGSTSTYMNSFRSSGEGGIPPATDLLIEKSGPVSATVGDEITYLITITNRGPDAGFAFVEDVLPSPLFLVSAVSSDADCEKFSDVFLCETLRMLESGEIITIEVTVFVPPATQPGTYTNVASVSRPYGQGGLRGVDLHPENNQASVDTTISAAVESCMDQLDRGAFQNNSFVGDGGCGVGGPLSLSASGINLTLDPFGANGAARFLVDGDHASSFSDDLVLYGEGGHRCDLECLSPDSFRIECSSSEGSCGETFTRE